MAENKPFDYKPLNVDNQTYVDILKSSLKKKNIISSNPEADKKTVVTTPLSYFYMNTLKIGPLIMDIKVKDMLNLVHLVNL